MRELAFPLSPKADYGTYHFHVTKWARELYEIDDYLFKLEGNLVLTNLFQARIFLKQLHDKKHIVSYDEEKVTAGNLFALGLISEVLHVVVAKFKQDINPNTFADLSEFNATYFNSDSIQQTMQTFLEQFPPVEVFRKTTSSAEYLAGKTKYTLNTHIIAEELLMLWLNNQNPAFAPFTFLFEDQELAKKSIYKELIQHSEEFFKTQPTYGPENLPLFELLQLPAKMNPDSIQDQLEWIVDNWGEYFGLDSLFANRFKIALGILKEENFPRGFAGPGPAEVIDYSLFDDDIEMYSQDANWMPRLVLIAKNSYVWLDQLSKKYQRPITTLDQIPDEELARLKSFGINGLWLIGLWERSKASKTIKQTMGNHDAVASAYSLSNYTIAQELGGQAALDNLKHRAAEQGIRLASDMVPNHMGIDSVWVQAHPDWFLSLDYPPYPTYSFNGQDLCDNPAIGVYLEDHYYSKSDASVVFKRVDHYTGDTRYIYHGNDGTSMPWNDTAQINFLNPNAKEAVIQTIISIAKQFPIIRFDAAMTLAKKHIQRLWFPQPGAEGAIPSRTEFGMTIQEFNKLMPEEFWREVVARVAKEAPDTLLLAEAFWMMEGFFVRNLGMHRVYNSAFMHMLRDEDNAKYRQLIKETLEYDPQILKRYVNFMNNPDEETAIEQFGKDDKYFGVCTFMATLPGLPMIGHGQFEGFSEKYGMEYKSAKWEEYEDQWLIDRHKRQISPVLHRRYLFADVANFRLYDFYTPHGNVDENVFAVSNTYGDQKALMIYHNRYATTRGTIKLSAAFLEKNGENSQLIQQELAHALNLPHLDQPQDYYLITKDVATGLSHIFSLQKVRDQGLTFTLNAYQTHVFIDFNFVKDDPLHHYRDLEASLNGAGVPDIDYAIIQMVFKDVQLPFKELINHGFIDYVKTQATASEPDWQELINQYETKTQPLLKAVIEFLEIEQAHEFEAKQVIQQIKAFAEALSKLGNSTQKKSQTNLKYLQEILAKDSTETLFFQWLLLKDIGKIINQENHALITRAWIEELNWENIIQEVYTDQAQTKGHAQYHSDLLKDMLIVPTIEDAYSAHNILQLFFGDVAMRRLLNVNTHKGIEYFNKEQAEKLVDLCLLITLTNAGASRSVTIKSINDKIDFAKQIKSNFEKSGYQVAKLIQILEQ